MKKLNSFVLALFVVFAFTKTEAQTKKIDLAKSKIVWTGKKITGQHQGTINFKEGYLVFKDNKVAGGNFTADMTSLTNTDQTGGSKAKLEGHLKSDDFFGVYNFKTSSLVFKSIGNKGNNIYFITADLTIKGITDTVQFELLVKDNTATAKVSIDRTKYDIKYGSGSFFEDLGDKTIYNDFDLDVNLVF